MENGLFLKMLIEITFLSIFNNQLLQKQGSMLKINIHFSFCFEESLVAKHSNICTLVSWPILLLLFVLSAHFMGHFSKASQFASSEKLDENSLAVCFSS